MNVGKRLVRCETMAALLLVGAGRAEAMAADPPTFNRDIAPIVFANCAPCHRPGEAGPFSLLSYTDVRSRARLIAAVTGARYMPPWLPEPGKGEFADERRLTDAPDRSHPALGGLGGSGRRCGGASDATAVHRGLGVRTPGPRARGAARLPSARRGHRRLLEPRLPVRRRPAPATYARWRSAFPTARWAITPTSSSTAAGRRGAATRRRPGSASRAWTWPSNPWASIPTAISSSGSPAPCPTKSGREWPGASTARPISS